MDTTSFTYRYVYGPVPSKRLGSSLGVDLAPLKRCTYDCVYCQLGRTTEKTVELKPYADPEAVCAELERKLACGPPPDYISLAGSGEPTLDAGIGEVIRRIKGMTTIPVAVLTNGSLLWREEVRSALLAADLVLPSLDAGDEALFQYVNRPHPEISFERMVGGLNDFVRLYRGPVWVEVFLLAGVTALPAEVGKIDAILRRIGPERIQLNTVTRPPAEEFALAVPDDQLEGLKGLFSQEAEVVQRRTPSDDATAQTAAPSSTGADIVSLLSRRPCTLDDICSGLCLRPSEALKHLGALCRAGAVEVVRRRDGFFYRAVERSIHEP
ncbi:MAG: radical SAM protein [Deltaproteobacteria bacterium]|nr:radical SAM protein [Deltaproteobacteria bacterium]